LLLLVILFSIPGNGYLMTEVHEPRLNEIIVSDDKVVWHCKAWMPYSVRSFSLNITLVSSNSTVILRYIGYINASVKAEAQLRYYVKQQGQAVEVGLLMASQLNADGSPLRETIMYKVVVANKSVKVQLHSYEIEGSNIYAPINTPMERDVSSQFMFLVHALNYHYVMNAISLLKILMSTKGVLVKYSTFGINIDISKYVRWLPSSGRTACSFINSTAIPTFNASNIVTYYTAMHRGNIVYRPLARGINLSDTIECLTPLMESLNNLALLLLSSILNNTQIDKVTLDNMMDILKRIANVSRFLNELSMHHTMLYNIRVHDKYLEVKCVVIGFTPHNNSAKVLRLFTTMHSYIANSTILRSVNVPLNLCLPMLTNVKYRSNTANVSTATISSIPLAALAYPMLSRTIIYLTLLLIVVQAAIVLYVFVRAIKNR